MKILVLGCGLMGPAAAKDCCESKDVTNVVGCDIDEGQLKKCSAFVSNKKFESSKLDLTDYSALVERMEGFDVVVNASAARFSLEVVKAAIKTGVNVVDLTSAYPLEGELYSKVETAGITVIPGCGVDPGLADILAAHAMDMLDEVEDVYFACGGLPQNPQPPLNYKIVFGGKKMPIRPGKVPVILDGNLVEVDRYDGVEPIHIEGFEDMEAFYDGYPSSLLKLCIKRGAKTFKGKTIRYKGFVSMLKILLGLGMLREEPIIHNKQEVTPIDFFHELIYPLVRFDAEAGDRDVTILLVTVRGKTNTSHLCVTYQMVDLYDEKEKVTSMARTTGYTAAVVARMLGRGDILQKGIQWPAYVIKGTLFNELMSSLRKKGIIVTENVLKAAEL